MKRKILSLVLSIVIVTSCILVSTNAEPYEVEPDAEVVNVIETEKTSDTVGENEETVDIEIPVGEDIQQAEQIISPAEKTVPMAEEVFDESLTAPVESGDDVELMAASGTCGDNVTWTLDDNGTLTISGTGDMKDYNYYNDTSPFYYNTNIESIIIENGVTNIGDYAFNGCTSLTNVVIGNGVTSIGGDAFNGCSSLTSITIPDSVTSIGQGAFCECDGLTSVTIPDSVTSIGAWAFSYMSRLTSVTIPDSVTSIGGAAFRFCGDLTSVTIGNGIKIIESKMFYACTSLTSVTIPDSVIRIDDKAFFDCSNLKSVYITDIASWCDIKFYDYSSNPMSYADNVYLNNKLLTDLVIPDNVTSIGDYAFRNYDGLTSLIISDSVTSIGVETFAYCDGLMSVTIGNGVLSIGDYAFSQCSSLEHLNYNASKVFTNLFDSYVDIGLIILGDNVTSIDVDAFSCCDELRKIFIPKSVTEIELSAFEDCTSLKDVYYGGSEDDWNQMHIGMSNDNLKNATIHYNSPFFPADNITLTTPLITTTEVENQWSFTVDVEQPYLGCTVYVALYDDSGVFLGANNVPLELFDNTTVTVDKQGKETKAKVFVWLDGMQPVTFTEETPLASNLPV